MILFFMVPGKPGAKQRARVTRRGITYTPKATVSWENHIKACFCAQYPNWKPVESPVCLKIVAYWPIPKNGKTKLWRILAAEEKTWRPSSPDWDNVGKAVSDALNNIAWNDDRQVVMCEIFKLYSERPRLDIEITIGEVLLERIKTPPEYIKNWNHAAYAKECHEKKHKEGPCSQQMSNRT